MENKEKIIYTKRLALELRQQGCKLLRTGINENFPQYITYVFEDSAKLQEILANQKKQK
jgi:hypothetical protein